MPVGVDWGVWARFTRGDWVGGGGWGVVEVAKFQPGRVSMVFVDYPFFGEDDKGVNEKKGKYSPTPRKETIRSQTHPSRSKKDPSDG